MKSIGENLKRLREEGSITQKSLALLAKVDQGQISRIERDIHTPSMDTLFCMAFAGAFFWFIVVKIKIWWNHS